MAKKGKVGLRMVPSETEHDTSGILPGTWIKVNAAGSKAGIFYRSKLQGKQLEWKKAINLPMVVLVIHTLCFKLGCIVKSN